MTQEGGLGGTPPTAPQNISDPTTPTLLGTYDPPGVASSVTVSGDYAFVAD